MSCEGGVDVTAIRHTPFTHLHSTRTSVLRYTTDYDVDVVVTEQGLVCTVSHLGRGPTIIIMGYGYPDLRVMLMDHESARPGST
jgi:hypothetical protein